MNNAEKFKTVFGLYATELWSMSEESFLSWLNSEYECKDDLKKNKWVEHHMHSRDYGKIYYQHDCCCDLYESPYRYCPNCGMEMERGDR
jgi:hypothetical protein